MKILRLDKSTWGNERLFNWPNKTKSQSQNLANQVVDYFHKMVREEEFNLQWNPGSAEIILNSEIPDIELLSKILDSAYQQAHLEEINQSELV